MQHELDILLNKCNGGTKTASELRTICFRQTHFLWYCYKQRILPRVFSLEAILPTTCFFNTVFGCYTVYLAKGHTLQARSICADTISKYLMAAALLVQVFNNQKRDPRKQDNKLTICPQIQKIIAEVQRFEFIPNQQEPLDVSMIRHHLKQSVFSLFTSKSAAMGNFWIVGYHAGLRHSKWCQEKLAHAVQGQTNNQKHHIPGTTQGIYY